MKEAYETKASAAKRRAVKEFTQLIDRYPIIGIVDVENLPSLQLNRMRAQLRDTVLIKMSKRRLLTLAINASKKKNIEGLLPYLKGMPAMLFTNESPFKLFKILKKNKSKAPIKAGQVAPNDIIVPAGPTGFAPGPIIGELGAFHIKTGVENGKIAIKEDAVVAKEGEVVRAKLAGILARLGIEPMSIGLNLTAIWEDGKILTKDVLDVDEEAYRKDFELAAAQAFNLSLNTGFPTSDTILPLIQNAHSEAYRLAVSQDVMTEETKNMLIAKAESQAVALKERIDAESKP